MQDDLKLLNPSKYLMLRVKDGSYFVDSRDWFYWKYVSAYKTRFYLSLLAIVIAFIILTFIINSFMGVLSVRAKNGIVNLQTEFGYEYIIQKLPSYYRSNEKNVLRFVIEGYVSFFESYDMNKFTIYKLNDMVDAISLHSSTRVVDKFKKIIQNNYTNEIFSGITRVATVTNVEFIYQQDDFKDKILRTIFPEVPSRKAVVYIDSAVYSNGTLLKVEKRKVELIFTFNSLIRDSSGNFSPLNFKVQSYNYL